MTKQWIKISHEWATHCKTYESISCINASDYLDLLGLFETCWLSFDFEDDDKKQYGYPSDE